MLGRVLDAGRCADLAESSQSTPRELGQSQTNTCQGHCVERATRPAQGVALISHVIISCPVNLARFRRGLDKPALRLAAPSGLDGKCGMSSLADALASATEGAAVGAPAGGLSRFVLDLAPEVGRWLFGAARQETAGLVAQAVETATGTTDAEIAETVLAKDPAAAAQLRVHLAAIAARLQDEADRTAESRRVADLAEMAKYVGDHPRDAFESLKVSSINLLHNAIDLPDLMAALSVAQEIIFQRLSFWRRLRLIALELSLCAVYLVLVLPSFVRQIGSISQFFAALLLPAAYAQPVAVGLPTTIRTGVFIVYTGGVVLVMLGSAYTVLFKAPPSAAGKEFLKITLAFATGQLTTLFASSSSGGG